jgi:hypothetical protein
MTPELTALFQKPLTPRPPSRGLGDTQEVPGQARDGMTQ